MAKFKYKLIPAIVLLLTILLLLIGCGDVGNGGTPGEDTTGGGTVTDDPSGGSTPGGGTSADEVQIPSDLNLSGITLSDAKFTYDGTKHSIEIDGEISNPYVSVKYTGNDNIGAGVYTVVAKFYYKDVYIEGKDKSATVTIERARYDMYGVSFDNMTVIADGNSHSLSVSGTLPRGVSVSYSGNAISAVGNHPVTATFTGDTKNYYPIDPMRAILTIKDGPAELAGVSMSNKTVVFNGSNHSVSYSGTLGAGVTFVGYDGNGQRNAGTHTVVAKFARDGVYDPTLSITAQIVIKPRILVPVVEDLTVPFDGEKHAIAVKWQGSGLTPPCISVVTEGNGVAAIGEHEVMFRFVPDAGEEDNFVGIEDITATLFITYDPTYAMQGLEFERLSTGKYAVSAYTGTGAYIAIPQRYTSENGITADVTSIKSGAFSDMTSIEYVYMPDTVTNIGNNAFSGCTALAEIRLGDNLKTVGQLAFEGVAIKSVILPDTLTAIAFGAFRGTELESITLPFIGGSAHTSNPYLGYIFGAPQYVGNAMYVPDTLKVVKISDKCTQIPAYSMYMCDGVEQVVIGSGVTSIGNAAFSGCTSLKGLYIPATVKEIPAKISSDDSPIYGVSSDFILYLEASAAGEGFGRHWKTLVGTKVAVAEYGKTYDEFLAAIEQ